MQSYLTPEEAAELLKIGVPEVMDFIDGGALRAIRLGNAIRIREADLERFLDAHAIGAMPAAELEPRSPSAAVPHADALPDGARGCQTRRGKQFKVRGSIEAGAE